MNFIHIIQKSKRELEGLQVKRPKVYLKRANIKIQVLIQGPSQLGKALRNRKRVSSSHEAFPEGSAADGTTRRVKPGKLGSIRRGGREEEVLEVLKPSSEDVVSAVHRHGRTMQSPKQAGQSLGRKSRKSGRMGVENHGTNALPRVEGNGYAQAHEKGVARTEAAKVGVLCG